MKKLIKLLCCFFVTATLFHCAETVSAAKSYYNEQKQQYNAQNASFNYSGKKTVKIVYDYKNRKSNIFYASSLDQKGKAVVSGENLGSGVVLEGNYIYYTEYKKVEYLDEKWAYYGYSIKKCKTNGKSPTTVVTFDQLEDGLKFIVYDSYII